MIKELACKVNWNGTCRRGGVDANLKLRSQIYPNALDTCIRDVNFARRAGMKCHLASFMALVALTSCEF